MASIVRPQSMEAGNGDGGNSSDPPLSFSSPSSHVSADSADGAAETGDETVNPTAEVEAIAARASVAS